jgi:hypothetical protein
MEGKKSVADCLNKHGAVLIGVDSIEVLCILCGKNQMCNLTCSICSGTYYCVDCRKLDA